MCRLLGGLGAQGVSSRGEDSFPIGLQARPSQHGSQERVGGTVVLLISSEKPLVGAREDV